jgi:hypothetical protein
VLHSVARGSTLRIVSTLALALTMTDTTHVTFVTGPEWSILSFRFGARRQFELELAQGFHFQPAPDFTPFSYLPRAIGAPCNPAGTAEAKQAEAWDFTDVDDQPGLSEQIARVMRRPPSERGVRIVAPRR